MAGKRSRQNRKRRRRATVLTRDTYICQYCFRHVSPGEATRDHVLPIALGGTEALNNLVCSCQQCQMWKDDRRIEDLSLPEWHQQLLTPEALQKKLAVLDLESTRKTWREEGSWPKGENMRSQR